MSSEVAVLDRIVDGTHAVLLVGAGEREEVVSASRLPTDARDGDRYLVTFADNELVQIETTGGADEERAELERRLERLRRTQSRGRFER